jgi:hypothetical protein
MTLPPLWQGHLQSRESFMEPDTSLSRVRIADDRKRRSPPGESAGCADRFGKSYGRAAAVLAPAVTDR